MKERLLSSAEAIEDQMFAAILLLVLIFWIGSCIRRIMEKEIRYMMLGIGICLMLWIILRFVKYQMLEMSIWKRYCWYLYYVAQLAIPALLYELAKATDKNKKQYLLSRNKMLAFYLISVILVITNDWHRLVFGFEADFYQWDYIHTYEPLYYIIVGISYLEIFFSFANIIRRVYLSNSRRIILYMSILMAVGCSYFLSYIAGIKIIKSTDFVMLASCICMLYCELLLRSWVIPLNSRHKDAIENSNLEIAILDRNGSIYCQSEGAVRFNQSLWEELLTAKDGYIQYLQTIRLHMKAITGGYVVWKEDISELERLQQEITLHVEALKTSTQLLEKKQMMEKARHMLESKQYLLEILGRETKEILLRIREKIAFARTPYPMTLFHLSRLAEVR